MAFLKTVFTSRRPMAERLTSRHHSDRTFFLCDSIALVVCSMILMNGAGVIFGREVGCRIAAGRESSIFVYICAVISAAQRQWKGR